MESSRVPIETATMKEKETTALSQRNLDGPVQVTKKKEKNSSSVACQVAQVLLRSLAALCMLGAVITMLFFTEQTITTAGFTITATYKSSPAFE